MILGIAQPQFILYLPRYIPYPELQNLSKQRTAYTDEITSVMQNCSNDWRKIFSIFSKIIHATLELEGTWQEYRDQRFLQKDGHEILVFEPTLLLESYPQAIHIIGSHKLFLEFHLDPTSWNTLDVSEKIIYNNNLFQTPYFDYRQFPNVLIAQLVMHLQNHFEFTKN